MNYTITGAAGNISQPLAKILLNAGHDVTVIGRNEEHLCELIHSGAKAAIGSVEDVEFLKTSFADADAVYTMYPSVLITDDLKACYENIAKNYAEAIIANNIRYVVNLSSIGAHLPTGAGPISGLHRAEKVLNNLQNVNVLHLRPAYFYTNFFGNISMAKHMSIIGGNFSVSSNKFPVANPADIAGVVANALMNLNFTGHSIRYVASDETGTDEIAAVLGKAIQKPELKWIKFSSEQALQGMLQSGLPKTIATEFVEMLSALDGGKVTEDYWKNRPEKLEPTKFEEFASVFANVYNAN
jgi:uncharacterized protein YbjT (DUF2867 family)